MGRTNIHNATSLLSRVGREFEEIAYLAYAEKLVYIISTGLNQSDLDFYTDHIRTNLTCCWFEKDQGCLTKFRASRADDRLPVPKIVVSRGLREPGSELPRRVSRNDNEPQDTMLRTPELSYVLLSQGSSGAMRAKITIEQTLERAAAHVMHEALNGYSVVFSAAILRVNLPRLSDDSYSLRVVQNSEELALLGSVVEDRVIGFWC
jgi:hypothetical protein